jgi:WD40-like Beta Propeller Repeat
MSTRHVWLAAIFLTASCISASACTTDGQRTPDAQPQATHTKKTVGRTEPSELIYVDGTKLFAFDLDSQAKRKVADLPSADVAISPDGLRYAVVKETSSYGSTPEGFRKPALVLGVLEREETSILGPGRSPLWSPDGKYIAAIAKAHGLLFCGEKQQDQQARVKNCRSTERVVAYPSEGNGASKTLLGANQWSLIGWTTEHRIMATSLLFNSVVVGYPGATFDDTETLGLEPAEVWGISPSEYALLVVKSGRTFFAYPGEGEGSTVELGGALLGDGRWSPDGKKIAAVAIKQGSRGTPKSSLVVIDVETGEAEAVPGSRDAQSAAVWTQDSAFFAYSRVDPHNPSKLQAVLCTAKLRCKHLFSWTQGVALLALR